MLFLNRKQVEGLLDLDALAEALAPAMQELSAGSVSMPPRVGAFVREREGLLGVMPVYLESSKTLAAKLVGIFPHNVALDVPSHQALIAIFDADTGTPLAVMDGEVITATRTAAGSALATKLLARPDAAVLTIVGTGVQARTHAQAISRVRDLREIRVVGRSPGKANALANELSANLAISARAVDSLPAALQGADLVCTTTHAQDPVMEGSWIEPGTHMNSVGFNPRGRELDAATVVKSVVVVESRKSALSPPPSGANDLLWPIRDGLIAEDHIRAEIGELLDGTRPGRTSDEQITLYKSVGVAVQDAAAANLVLTAAKEKGVGTELEL